MRPDRICHVPAVVPQSRRAREVAHAVRETYDESYNPGTADSSRKQKDLAAKATATSATGMMGGDTPTAEATIAAALRQAAVKVIGSVVCHVNLRQPLL